ncbi:MAG: winged helix-turn-helix domain-containing protein, partial [Dehalococcoidia bacterium]
AITKEEAAYSRYQHGELYIDVETPLATLKQKNVRLTSLEWAVLRVLVRNAGQVVTPRGILQEAWGTDYGDENDYVRTYISRLRRKLEPKSGSPCYIVTERGIGYRLIDPE